MALLASQIFHVVEESAELGAGDPPSQTPNVSAVRKRRSAGKPLIHKPDRVNNRWRRQGLGRRKPSVLDSAQ